MTVDTYRAPRKFSFESATALTVSSNLFRLHSAKAIRPRRASANFSWPPPR
jgi:hypothetical protein